MDKLISASIVLYNHKYQEIEFLISSIIKSPVHKLIIIDNSLCNNLENYLKDDKIVFLHNPLNPGFGASHNMAINTSINLKYDFHFIINPDIVIGEETIEKMISYIILNKDVGMMMPKILNLDGSLQYLPKLLPSPFDIILRKLKFPKLLFNNYIHKLELRSYLEDKILNVPILSGCFLLVDLNVLNDVGVFDENYFMYFEDWDLSRRVHLKYKTLYFPKTSVYHGYNSGANKNFRLFKIFLLSGFYYFFKWGFFVDANRSKFNNKVLKSLDA